MLKLLYQNKGIRYLLSGGISTLVDLFFFKVFYDLIFCRENFTFLGFVFEGYSISLVISYTFGSVTSFLMNKYFVFGRQDQGVKQLLKALPVYILAFLGNYILLKICIEKFYFWPILARLSAALFVAFITFNLHKYFSFKSKS